MSAVVPSVSVVLPIYSEQRVLYKVVRDIKRNLGPALLEIIAIVSPKSPERTLRICKDLHKKHAFFRFELQKENPGLGCAVRQGIARAKGEYVLLMDSDDEMEAAAIGRMMERLRRKEYDLILASRWLRKHSFVGYDPIKLHMNRWSQRFLRFLLGLRASDMTLGYKLVRRSLLKRLGLEGKRHEIAVETSIKPLLAGARWCEVPTIWTARTEGASKNSWKNHFRYLRMAFKVFWHYRLRRDAA